MHIKRAFLLSMVAAGLMLNVEISHAVDVYHRETTAATSLSSSGGVPTTVLQVNIPGGTWRVIAKSSVVNFGPADFVRCLVKSGATQIDSAATMIGEAGGMPAVATITNMGVIITSVTTVFSLECQHDAPIAGMYVDPDAKLIVERVSSGCSRC
jgi:hypothetical protein